jgi:uncharacterized protein YndB with AHSA1/START domain
MPNDFEPVVGHRFEFRTRPRPGFNGVVRCEVVEVETPRRLSYTWQGGPMRRPTLVTFTLEPATRGTRLRLEHGGFGGFSGRLVRGILGMGWGKLLSRRLPTALACLSGGNTRLGASAGRHASGDPAGRAHDGEERQ